MNQILTRRYSSLLSIIALLVFLLFSCKKNINDSVDTVKATPDLITKVTSSVSGFVTDQNNGAVVGATVKAGGSNTTTDRYGYFELKNIEVVKEAATVEVSYTGYFKGIKTYMATEGKAAFFRIKLLQKTMAGTINATSGGSVSLSNGLNISLPANAVKNAATGAAYSGTINVAAQFIDPTSTELNNIMPGDLRGINTDGNIKGLTSYGMMAVELTGASGESLQIADGKKATITFPVPATINGSAPATIPLWYFNESNGLWKEEGTATKSGNTFVGEVSHFSFWNCDLPNAIVSLNFTLVDSAGNPMQDVLFEILPVSIFNGHVIGNTDRSGYVNVPVSPNTQYQLRIVTSSTLTFTKTFSVGEASLSLGNIVVEGNFVSVHGTISGCNNSPTMNGRVIINDGYQNWIPVVQANGSFEFSVFTSFSGQATINIIAEDLTNHQQSPVHTFSLTNSVTQVGNIQACGVSTDTYLDFKINGRTFIADNNYSSNAVQENYGGPDSLITTCYWTTDETQNGVPIPNSVGNVYMRFLSFGSPQVPASNFVNFVRPFYDVLNYSMHIYPLAAYSNNQRGLPINITEYGSIGGFIAGSFSGVLYENQLGSADPDLARPYNVSCNFRIRRSQ